MRDNRDSDDYYNMLKSKKVKKCAEDYEESVEERAWTE